MVSVWGKLSICKYLVKIHHVPLKSQPILKGFSEYACGVSWDGSSTVVAEEI